MAAMLECPFPGCQHCDFLLHEHLRNAHAGAVVSFSGETTVTWHQSTAYQVLLHEPDVERVYVLHLDSCPASEKGHSRALRLVCVGPPPDEADFRLRLSVRTIGEPPHGHMIASYRGVLDTRRWAGPGPFDENNKFSYLYVPNNYWSSSGNVSVTVALKKAPPSSSSTPSSSSSSP